MPPQPSASPLTEAWRRKSPSPSARLREIDEEEAKLVHERDTAPSTGAVALHPSMAGRYRTW
jgi:hypothetical protein